MILTPLADEELARALDLVFARLDGPAAIAFARMAGPRRATRACGAEAEAHRRAAIAVARRFGMALLDGSPADGFSWDGTALRTGTDAYVLLHEVAHFQLAPAARRCVVDFGLGAGPETGRREEADRAQSSFGLAREREEAEASLLGILWEAALGQPALASFLDQNWLEGAERPSSATHFAAVFGRLLADGFVDAAGRPTERLRLS